MSKQVDEVMELVNAIALLTVQVATGKTAEVIHAKSIELAKKDAELRAKLEELSPPDGWEAYRYRNIKADYMVCKNSFNSDWSLIKLDGMFTKIISDHPTAHAAMQAAEGSEG